MRLWGFQQVLTEVTTLGVIPSEPFILERHEMVQNIMFDGPEEAQRMKVVGFALLLLGVTTTGCEQWKDQWNGWDVSESVSDNVSLDVEF